MAFDGRFLTGAAPIGPVLHHPDAPAVGDLCAQSLRAAYLYGLHQATVIGTQTWPLRLRRLADQPKINVAALERVGEWCAVHLATHHSRIVAHFAFGAVLIRDWIRMRARLVVVDGANTDTGATFTLDCNVETGQPRSALTATYAIEPTVQLVNVTLPTSSARVYLEAQAVHGVTGVATTVAYAVPLHATVWRVST